MIKSEYYPPKEVKYYTKNVKNIYCMYYASYNNYVNYVFNQSQWFLQFRLEFSSFKIIILVPIKFFKKS